MDTNSPIRQSHKPRVLIVEDESAVRRMLVAVLSAESSYDVVDVPTGALAQEVLLAGGVDVVVTDLLMPKMTGLTLMQWGREKCPGPLWIILTGRGTFDDAVRAVQLGAFDFISKPLPSNEMLLVSVRNAIAHRTLQADRTRLLRNVEDQNIQLQRQVDQLREACRLLCRQAETIESDLRRAELIQRALLPSVPPRLDSVNVHAVYRPSLAVGGDLYDVVALDDSHVAAYVADAAGHGVSAAMLTVLFKHRLAMLDHAGRPASPAEALAAVNKSIMDECSAPGLFVTAAYCLLDTRMGEMVIASAGHTPLVLRQADGKVQEIYHTGPALGLSPRATFAQKRITFGKGDRLLLYTDGLFETAAGRRELSVEQIADCLADDGLAGSDVVANLLELASAGRKQTAQEDDLTVLLLQGGAGDSSIDNSQMDQPAPAPLHETPARAEVMIGRSTNTVFYSISGCANWTYCAAFHDSCLAELQAGRCITLDMSLCLHMDSTFLGTIQTVVDHADRGDLAVVIQGLLPQVLELFEQLGMQRVVERVAPGMMPLPSTMCPLEPSDEADGRNRRLVLEAHKQLAGLNEENRAQFVRLIEQLEAELTQART